MSIPLDVAITSSLGYDIHKIDNYGVWVYFPFEQSDPTLFEPSDNSRDAWIVVEELEKTYNQMIFVETRLDSNGIIDGYIVQFFDYNDTGRGFESQSESFPVAVCQAGIKALSYLKEETISESINKIYS